MTCLPSGASDGSCTVGKQSSMCAGSAAMPGARLRLLHVHVGDERVHLHDAGVVRLHPALGQAARLRQLGHREVDLHAGPHAAVGTDRRQERVGKVGLVDQSQERALRVGVRQHARCAQLLTVRQRHARRSTVHRDDAFDLGAGPDLGAGLARRVRHHLRHATHAAADEPPRARPAAGLLARVIVQQHERGPGRGRAGDAVVDRVPAERGHHVLGLEPLGEELRRRTW